MKSHIGVRGRCAVFGLRVSVHNRRRRSGFSLTEILITVVVITVALVPLLGYFVMSPRRTAHSVDRALGSNLALQTLERFRRTSYNRLQAYFGEGAAAAAEILETDPVVGLDSLPTPTRQMMEAHQFVRNVRFEEVPGEPGLGVLTIEVSWKPPNLPPSSLELARVIVDYSQVASTSQ